MRRPILTVGEEERRGQDSGGDDTTSDPLISWKAWCELQIGEELGGHLGIGAQAVLPQGSETPRRPEQVGQAWP